MTTTTEKTLLNDDGTIDAQAIVEAIAMLNDDGTIDAQAIVEAIASEYGIDAALATAKAIGHIPEWTVSYRDDSGASDDSEIVDAVTEEEAMAEAASLAGEWCRGGDWGVDGASIPVWWRVSLGNYESDEDSETIEIKPNHDALILQAGGDTGCDHDWTSEGEGGCSENPGVWSTGAFSAHCRRCGLHRVEYSTGSQRNPGEHDSVEYYQPANWCAKCESEYCSCESDED